MIWFVLGALWFSNILLNRMLIIHALYLGSLSSSASCPTRLAEPDEFETHRMAKFSYFETKSAIGPDVLYYWRVWHIATQKISTPNVCSTTGIVWTGLRSPYDLAI